MRVFLAVTPGRTSCTESARTSANDTASMSTRIAPTIRQQEDENREAVVRVAHRTIRQKKSLLVPSRLAPELVHSPQPISDPVPTGWY
jgi:hypothetical protein